MSEINSKPWYLSRTILTNIFLLIVFQIKPELGEQIGGEAGLAVLFSFVNVVLRAVTKSKLELK
jgi:hypothetical protein